MPEQFFPSKIRRGYHYLGRVYTRTVVKFCAVIRCAAVGEGESSCVIHSISLFGMGIAYSVQFESTVHYCAYVYVCVLPHCTSFNVNRPRVCGKCCPF